MRNCRSRVPELSLGPYLKTLGQDLRLVEKQDPVFGEGRRRARYAVSDPFLLAWMSVIHPACQAARIEPVSRVAGRLTDRLRTLEGFAFERMVREATEGASRAGVGFPVSDRVKGYWNRPRRTDVSIEIDLVAWNEEDRVVRFGSCKTKRGKARSKGARQLPQAGGSVSRIGLRKPVSKVEPTVRPLFGAVLSRTTGRSGSRGIHLPRHRRLPEHARPARARSSRRPSGVAQG